MRAQNSLVGCWSTFKSNTTDTTAITSLHGLLQQVSAKVTTSVTKEAQIAKYVIRLKELESLHAGCASIKEHLRLQMENLKSSLSKKDKATSELKSLLKLRPRVAAAAELAVELAVQLAERFHHAFSEQLPSFNLVSTRDSFSALWTMMRQVVELP